MLPFLIDEETETYIQRNAMTYSELHLSVSGKVRFIYKHFDSEFHLLSPKRKWCCGVHVNHRAWVKATARPRNRERWPQYHSVTIEWYCFHSISCNPTGRSSRTKQTKKEKAAFWDSKVWRSHLFLLQLLTKIASFQASKRSSLVFSIYSLSIEGDSNHRSSIFLSFSGAAFSGEAYEWR